MSGTTTWDDFRLVKAIADTRSLGGAASTLGLNHSTVFRRLGALEDGLGTRLFERARTGYAPTAAGEEMIALASRMGEDIVDFERKIAGQDVKPSGELRVTTNDTALVHLMPPIFASFRRAYPDIRLDVIVGNEALNLSKRDADVAVRATERPLETLVGRRIADVAWAPYAWLEFDGELELSNASWVGFGDRFATLAMARWLGENADPDRIVYRINTILGMAEAVAAGIGLGLLPCFIGERTPGLKRIREPTPALDGALWLLTHSDLRHSARVRAFMDHAGAELVKMRPLLDGTGVGALNSGKPA